MKIENNTPANPPVKLVLNGGGEIMDSATLPVEWHFSPQVIEEKPYFVLLYDFAGSLEEFRKSLRVDNIFFGERSMHRVSDLAAYLQLKKPGRHTIFCFVLCGNESHALYLGRQFCKLNESGNRYINSLYWNENKPTSDIFAYDTFVLEGSFKIYVGISEIEVPEELFAKPPKSRFGRLIWQWVNRWYHHPPVDECMYRRRKIFAFTIQPPLFLIGRLITGVFFTLYTVLGSILLILVGVRPDLKNLLHAWWRISMVRWNLAKFSGEYSNQKFPAYWRAYKVDPKTGKYCRIPIWAVPAFVPFELFFILFSGFFIYQLAHSSLLPLFLFFVALVLIITFIIPKISKKDIVKAWLQTWLQKRRKVKQIRKDERRIAEEEYLEFLKSNASIDNAPDKVNIHNIIKRVDSITKFRLSFWALKSRVCRPFSQ